MVLHLINNECLFFKFNVTHLYIVIQLPVFSKNKQSFNLERNQIQIFMLIFVDIFESTFLLYECIEMLLLYFID